MDVSSVPRFPPLLLRRLSSRLFLSGQRLASLLDGPGNALLRFCFRGVAEHHVAAQERVAAAAAEAESHKGVAGAVKKARKALAGQQKKNARKSSKK